MAPPIPGVYGNSSSSNVSLHASPSQPYSSPPRRSEGDILQRLKDFLHRSLDVPDTVGVDQVVAFLRHEFESPIILASSCTSDAECTVFKNIINIVEVFEFSQQLSLVADLIAEGRELVVHMIHSS